MGREERGLEGARKLFELVLVDLESPFAISGMCLLVYFKK